MRRSSIRVMVVLIAVQLLLGSGFTQAPSPKTSAQRSPSTATAKPKAPPQAKDAHTTPSGLTYTVTRHGTGAATKAGEIVIVHYTGLLTSGVKFDSSRDRNDPISFKLGAGRVIKGWDEGIAKLRIGDQAVLVIPPALGYGQRNVGNGLIPPNSTLIFVIEIVDTKAKALSDELEKAFNEKGMDAVIEQFHEMQKSGFGDIYAGESELNGLGYRFMRTKKFKEAIEVLKLNVEAFPKSANVYDSLAEAYMANGDKQLAIENYEKAISIDATLESAKTNLKKLKEN